MAECRAVPCMDGRRRACVCWFRSKGPRARGGFTGCSSIRAVVRLLVTKDAVVRGAFSTTCVVRRGGSGMVNAPAVLGARRRRAGRPEGASCTERIHAAASTGVPHDCST